MRAVMLSVEGDRTDDAFVQLFAADIWGLSPSSEDAGPTTERRL